MKKLILTIVAALGMVAGSAMAAGGGHPLDKAPVKTNDLASLQNGAKLFVNYCLNCHSAAFMRFNRLKDIGLTDQQVKDNLLFTTDKVGETMKAAIDPNQAKEWFGANPPDLTARMLKGKTLGFIGYGGIAREMTARLAGLVQLLQRAGPFQLRPGQACTALDGAVGHQLGQQGSRLARAAQGQQGAAVVQVALDARIAPAGKSRVGGFQVAQLGLLDVAVDRGGRVAAGLQALEDGLIFGLHK